MTTLQMRYNAEKVAQLVAKVSMTKEKQAMKTKSFKRIVYFAKTTEQEEGINANVEEVDISPQNEELVGCGDVSFQ